jgi:hypothetical protein
MRTGEVHSSQPRPRKRREQKTIRVMVEIFCRNHHATRKDLCASCSELLEYALEKLDKCPFHETKPTCRHCQVHCYTPAQREKVRQVMQYAGPRMMLRHPVLALKHVLDNRKMP